MSLSFAIMNDRSIDRFALIGNQRRWPDWSVDEYANVPDHRPTVSLGTLAYW